MKNLGIKVLTIGCGAMAIMNLLLSLLGLICLLPDMCLFFAVPTLLFGFPTVKLARKLGWIKPKVKVEKVKPVKEEPVMESEQLMFDFKEEPVKEEPEPVKEKVSFKEKLIDKIDAKTKQLEKYNKEMERQRIERENNKTEEEKAKEAESERRWNKAGEIIGSILGTLLAVGVIVGGVVLAGYILYYAVIILANVIMYVLGFLIFLALAASFISFWWSLVRHEHVDKPRGIVRVKVKRRRW